MPDRIKLFIRESKTAQFIIVFIAGLVIGAVFYPSSRTEKKSSEKYEQQISKLNEQHSKEISDARSQITSLEQKNESIEKQYQGKMSSMSQRISQLQKSKKVNHYKLIRPDGTIEERTVIEDNVTENVQAVEQVKQEYEAKLTAQAQSIRKESEDIVLSIQRTFDRKEREYQQKISSLETSEVKQVNIKRFGVEAGILLNRSYYLHATADLTGPLFLGTHAETGFNSTVGLGLGLRF
jgi:hypothetical protein